MNTETVGKFLKELRKEQNITQEQLGEKIGVTNKTISKWENGKYMPPIDMLEVLSEMYDVSINEILCGRRLNDVEYKENAEENMKDVLAKLPDERQFRVFHAFLWIVEVLFFIILGLTLNLDGSSLLKIGVIVAALLMSLISNVFNMCFYIAIKEMR